MKMDAERKGEFKRGGERGHKRCSRHLLFTHTYINVCVKNKYRIHFRSWRVIHYTFQREKERERERERER